MKFKSQIFAKNNNRALIAQELVEGFHFERLIAHAKANETNDLESLLELETDICVGSKILIDYECKKPLSQLVPGDTVTINGFAESFRLSYIFEEPIEFVIPKNFVKEDQAPAILADNDQQAKIDNLRSAIDKLKNYGQKLAGDDRPLISKGPEEYVFGETPLKARKGIESFLLANQLSKKLDHFLLENPKPSPESYKNFVRDMKVILRQKDQLFLRHRDEVSLIIRDILLALTIIAPIIWIGKAVYSYCTNGNYSLFKNLTQTEKNVNDVEDRLTNCAIAKA